MCIESGGNNDAKEGYAESRHMLMGDILMAAAVPGYPQR